MTATGIIVSKRDKFITLDDERFFSAWTPSVAYSDVSEGDVVKFAYVDKESGGKTYHNIKGKVELLEAGAGPRVPPADASTGGGAQGAARAAHDKPGNPPIHTQRSICRAVALKAAVDYLTPAVEHEVKVAASPAVEPSDVIDVAKVFEAYLTGDSDVVEAEALLDGVVHTHPLKEDSAVSPADIAAYIEAQMAAAKEEQAA
jgi:hypothetical protein